MATEVEGIQYEKAETMIHQICPYCDDTGESLLHMHLRLLAVLNQSNEEWISVEQND